MGIGERFIFEFCKVELLCWHGWPNWLGWLVLAFGALLLFFFTLLLFFFAFILFSVIFTEVVVALEGGRQR